MVIIEDTRNQVGKHQELNRQLAKMGHNVIRSKLLVGDYTKAKDQSVCIDTKQNFREVFGNIYGKQHARFREECIRAKSAEISLIILIEEETHPKVAIAFKQAKIKPRANWWRNPTKSNDNYARKIRSQVQTM